jgi:hypothetical protein
MGQSEIRDVLALAELEEAAEVENVIDADPLSFKWAVPLAQ